MIYIDNLFIAIAMITAISLIIVFLHIRFPRTIYRRVYSFYHTLIHIVAKSSNRKRVRDLRLATLSLKIAIAILLIFSLVGTYIVFHQRVPLELHGLAKLTIEVKPPVVLIVDTSGSMGGEKIVIAKQALRLFIENLTTNVDIGLIEFAGSVKQGIPPIDDRNKILRAINSMKAEGGTMYSYALETALTWLKPYREFNVSCYVVMVTDGLPADISMYRKVLKEFKKLSIPIYTIFIGGDPKGIEETKLIARETGGKQYTAREVSRLVNTLNEIAKEINKKITEIKTKVELYRDVEIRKPLSHYLLLLALPLYLILRYAIYRKTRVSF